MLNEVIHEALSVFQVMLFMVLCFNILSLITLSLSLIDSSYERAYMASIVLVGLSCFTMISLFWYLRKKIQILELH
jgi:general stress protein CsbA